MENTDEFNNIWVNDGDGSVIFTTAPPQSDHLIHKYESIQQAITDLETIISGLRNRLPIEDQPEDYGSLVAESLHQEILNKHFEPKPPITLKRERCGPSFELFRECDENGSILKPGPKIPTGVRFAKNFLESLRTFKDQDTEFISLTLGEVHPPHSRNQSTKTKDI